VLALRSPEDAGNRAAGPRWLVPEQAFDATTCTAKSSFHVRCGPLIAIVSDRRSGCRLAGLWPVYGQSLASLWPVSRQSLASLPPVSRQSLAGLSPVSRQSPASLPAVSRRSLVSLWAASEYKDGRRQCDWSIFEEGPQSTARRPPRQKTDALRTLARRWSRDFAPGRTTCRAQFAGTRLNRQAERRLAWQRIWL
jgi:hypothetical protein